MNPSSNNSSSAAVRMVSSGNNVPDVNVTLNVNHVSVSVSTAAASFVSADNSPGAAAAASVAIRNSGTPTKSNSNSTSTNPSESGEEDTGVIAAPASLNTSSFQSGGGPAEIPPEPSSEGLGEDRDGEEVEGSNEHQVQQEEEEEDDESEYEYEDDEDAAFSGFLVDHPALATQHTTTTTTTANDRQGDAAGSVESPARIRDEEEPDDDTSDADDTAMGSTEAAADNRKAKWREPSRAAVSMSLRAEREKTGSKRRLAQDLYRIMNQDTEEAGFNIAPKSEDNMDHWIIKLFMFDEDSNLAKDMQVLGFEHIELEMTFPDQYPFEPPFVRVVRPRFKRQTGFVMNGALCMELLTKDGWNPVNDIESVIVSIRSLLVVGDGRLQAAYEMPEPKYQARLKANKKSDEEQQSRKRQKTDDESRPNNNADADGGSYSVAEAHAAYSHLSDYHKKKGWDSSGWWARKG